MRYTKLDNLIIHIFDARLRETRTAGGVATVLPELGGILVTGGEEWFCNGREKYIKSTSTSTAELLIIAKSQSIPMGELPVLVADHSICHIGQNRVVLSGMMSNSALAFPKNKFQLGMLILMQKSL